MSTTATDQDYRKAIQLAEDALRSEQIAVTDYALIRAENILYGTATCKGPRCWRMTFKQRALIPGSAAEEIGAGGEVFVEVDVATSAARVTGHGE